jgi:hypothetical protein
MQCLLSAFSGPPRAIAPWRRPQTPFNQFWTELVSAQDACSRSARRILIPKPCDQVIIKGPRTKEEKVVWDQARERLKECDREIEYLNAMLKDTKRKSHRHIIQDDILHEKRLRDIIVKAIGEPRRDDVQ